jgi:hypothetical protein
LQTVSTLVTDDGIPPDLLDQLIRCGLEVVVAEKDELLPAPIRGEVHVAHAG